MTLNLSYKFSVLLMCVLDCGFTVYVFSKMWVHVSLHSGQGEKFKACAYGRSEISIHINLTIHINCNV